MDYIPLGSYQGIEKYALKEWPEHVNKGHVYNVFFYNIIN